MLDLLGERFSQCNFLVKQIGKTQQRAQRRDRPVHACRACDSLGYFIRISTPAFCQGFVHVVEGRVWRLLLVRLVRAPASRDQTQATMTISSRIP